MTQSVAHIPMNLASCRTLNERATGYCRTRSDVDDLPETTSDARRRIVPLARRGGKFACLNAAKVWLVDFGMTQKSGPRNISIPFSPL